MKNKLKFFFITYCSSLVSISAYSQQTEERILNRIRPEKDGEKNTLYSLDTYDSMGNLFMVRKKFDHQPTYSDCVEFAREIPTEIDKMMKKYGEDQQKYFDSIKSIYPQNNIINSKKKREIPQ
jgi:hypothetical protein